MKREVCNGIRRQIGLNDPGKHFKILVKHFRASTNATQNNMLLEYCYLRANI